MCFPSWEKRWPSCQVSNTPPHLSCTAVDAPPHLSHSLRVIIRALWTIFHQSWNTCQCFSTGGSQPKSWLWNHSEWVGGVSMFLQNFNNFCRKYINSSFYLKMEKPCLCGYHAFMRNWELGKFWPPSGRIHLNACQTRNIPLGKWKVFVSSEK